MSRALLWYAANHSAPNVNTYWNAFAVMNLSNCFMLRFLLSYLPMLYLDNGDAIAPKITTGFSIGAVIISTVKDIWYIPKMYFLHPTSLVDRKIIASLKCLGFFIFLFLYNHFKFTSSQIHNSLNLSISSTENFFVNHICVHLIITIFSSFLLQSWKKDHWVVVEFSILVGSRSTIYLKIFTYQYM